MSRYDPNLLLQKKIKEKKYFDIPALFIFMPPRFQIVKGNFSFRVFGSESHLRYVDTNPSKTTISRL